MASNDWPTTLDGATATVMLHGELDLATTPSLRDHLDRLYTEGSRDFVLDSSNVSFVDSVGLSAILALYHRCEDEDGSIVIKSPSRVMQRTLEVAGLDDVLEIVQ